MLGTVHQIFMVIGSSPERQEGIGHMEIWVQNPSKLPVTTDIQTCLGDDQLYIGQTFSVNSSRELLRACFEYDCVIFHPMTFRTLMVLVSDSTKIYPQVADPLYGLSSYFPREIAFPLPLKQHTNKDQMAERLASLFPITSGKFIGFHFAEALHRISPGGISIINTRTSISEPAPRIPPPSTLNKTFIESPGDGEWKPRVIISPPGVYSEPLVSEKKLAGEKSSDSGQDVFDGGGTSGE